jgi:hypothetical protein
VICPVYTQVIAWDYGSHEARVGSVAVLRRSAGGPPAIPVSGRETVAINRPETDQPWYRILPDGSAHEAYVAQRNLVPDDDGQRIRHPLVWLYFKEFRDGAYVPAKRAN